MVHRRKVSKISFNQSCDHFISLVRLFLCTRYCSCFDGEWNKEISTEVPDNSLIFPLLGNPQLMDVFDGCTSDKCQMIFVQNVKCFFLQNFKCISQLMDIKMKIMPFCSQTNLKSWFRSFSSIFVPFKLLFFFPFLHMSVRVMMRMVMVHWIQR